MCRAHRPRHVYYTATPLESHTRASPHGMNAPGTPHHLDAHQSSRYDGMESPWTAPPFRGRLVPHRAPYRVHLAYTALKWKFKAKEESHFESLSSTRRTAAQAGSSVLPTNKVEGLVSPIHPRMRAYMVASSMSLCCVDPIHLSVLA